MLDDERDDELVIITILDEVEVEGKLYNVMIINYAQIAILFLYEAVVFDDSIYNDVTDEIVVSEI